MRSLQIPHAGRDGARVAGEAFDGLDLGAEDGSRAVIFAEVGEGELQLDAAAISHGFTIEISASVGKRKGKVGKEKQGIRAQYRS